MRAHIPLAALVTAGVAAAVALPSMDASAATTARESHPSHPTTYAVGTPSVDTVSGGGWTLAQGPARNPGSDTPASGFTGDPGPLAGFCASGGPNPQTGARVRQPAGTSLPMQPYYFPYVTSSDGGRLLTGYFDYRPKDADEAVVAATSTDGGHHWTYRGQALELNRGVCANGNTVDDGQGHPFVMSVGSGRHATSLLYTLSRPGGDAPGVDLIVHTLHPKGGNPLAGLPASEPVGLGGSTTATADVQIPAGPGPAGGGGVTLPVASTAGFEAAGQVTVDGATVDCGDDAMTATGFDGCTTTDPAGVTVHAGDRVAAPPVIPVDARHTRGLLSPDGIDSVLPRPLPGAPAHAVSVLYTEKIDGYYAPTTTTAKLALPAATIPVVSTSGLHLAGGAITVSLGTDGGIVQVTCTGEDATDLTGCTGGTGTVSSGSSVGAPGAAVAPYATLARIGEGKNKSKSLYGNNEDYTVLRGAWTTDGITFHDLGVTSGLSDPSSNTPGVLRWIGSRGTVVTNPDGTLGLFESGADVDQGDSDAFGEIFYAHSTDGLHWSAPHTLIGVDDTFGALAAQAAAGPLSPLRVDGYYSGRVYDPTVVQNRDGSVTMIFAGYSTPKPLPAVGSVLGTDPAAPYTVPTYSLARYRTILTVRLTPTR